MKIARIKDSDGKICSVQICDNGSLKKVTQTDFSPPKPSSKFVKATQWLSPVNPRAILCIGLNYKSHADEGGFQLPKYPVVFFKNPGTIVGHKDNIIIPNVCQDEVDFEGELAVVIGKTCKNVKESEAMDYVYGYCIANDVSARIWQTKKGGSQWCRAKSFDTFCPLGPVLVTADQIPEPNNLMIETKLNGQIVQQSNTRDMIFNIRQLISFLTQDTTLLAGTVILTGTPEGIGWAREPKTLLHSGDTISIKIEKIGRLENHVA